MRVLQINSVCGIGSTGRIATDIHNVLLEQGYESYIAYGRYQPKSCNNAIKIGNKLDNYWHVAITRFFDRHGYGSKRATKRFIKEIKNLDPDIIHLHNIHGYYINIKILFEYLKKAGKPVVWTLHDCWSFTGHCSYFDFADCNKWQTRCYDCPQKGTYPKSIMLDNSRKNYDEKKELFTSIKNLTIVTPSMWLANLVKKSFLGVYPVEVINNGIDLNIFKPVISDVRQKYNISDKFIILGVASDWSERKGLKYFVELSQKLSSDEVIVIVGIDDSQKRKLPRNIISISKTNNAKELAEIYAAADVFINPTLEDNYPTVNLESIACGTPIITFDTGGSPESIVDENGIVTEKKNSDSLLDALKIIKKKNKYKATASNKYDKITSAKDYLIIYSKVMTNYDGGKN